MMRRCFWAFVGAGGALLLAALAFVLSGIALLFSPIADLVLWRRRKSLAGFESQCHGEPGVDCPVHPMTAENQIPVEDDPFDEDDYDLEA